MRKNAEILSKIQSRLNDVTSVGQTMQQGAFNAFGNNFLTRGAMSATGLIGDLLNGENEQSQTPEAQMVSLFKEQMQIMDAVLLENKKHTEVLTNFTETLPSLVYGGNDRSRLNGAPFDSYDYPDQKVMTVDQWERFMKQMEDSRTHENFQENKPEPNPFAWMTDQAIRHPASSLPPEQIISVDEIIESPNKKSKKKTQDVEDVEIKAPVLRIEYEDVKKSFKATEDKSKTPDALRDSDASVKDSPNPFSSIAKDLYDRSDSKMDSESITEDAEEKDKDRFFKSVVGLLTKIYLRLVSTIWMPRSRR
jgi:hypothetical protein